MPTLGRLIRLLLLTTFLVGCGEDEPPRPELLAEEEKLERVNYDTRAGDTAGTREELEAPPEEREKPSVEKPSTPTDPDPELTRAEPQASDQPVVILRVVDAQTKQRVFDFLGTPVDSNVDVESFRRSENGELRYERPKTGDFELQLDAEGYISPEPFKLEFDERTPVKILTVEVQSASQTSGILLRASRTDTTAVTNLQIRVESRPLNAPSTQPFKLVWERISVDPEGEHKLPDLKAGRYKLLVFPVNEQKRPELFVPQELEFDFDEIRALEQVLVFQPGGQIALQVEDPNTGLPVEARSVQVQLFDGFGELVDRNWRPLNREERSQGLETLPVAGRCDLHRPIAPGLYTLKVRRNGIDQEPIEQSVSVVGGMSREVTIR